MRSTLFLISMMGLFTFAHAQQSDSTKTEPVVPQSELPDTAKAESPAPAIEPEQSAPTTTTSSEDEDSKPRIIYYQSGNSRDDGYQRRYSSRNSRKQDIKTLAGSMNHSGGFGALSFRMTDFEDETMVMAGVRAGWIINRTVGIGFEGHGIIPTAQLSNIDPTQDVVALGGYGGMFMEFIILSNQVVHLTFPASAGAGWLGYSTDWENNSLNGEPSAIIHEDIFWYVEPGANIEMNVSRNFRLAFGVSKRFTQDLELENTSANAFDQLNYYVTLKIGGF
jgi:hypothetical protein